MTLYSLYLTSRQLSLHCAPTGSEAHPVFYSIGAGTEIIKVLGQQLNST
jgi:hypothetical protein